MTADNGNMKAIAGLPTPKLVSLHRSHLGKRTGSMLIDSKALLPYTRVIDLRNHVPDRKPLAEHVPRTLDYAHVHNATRVRRKVRGSGNVTARCCRHTSVYVFDCC